MDSATVAATTPTTTTPPSSSNATGDSNLGEINFEELIKATNVTPRIMKEDLQSEENIKLTEELAQKVTGQPKIAPKPNSVPTKAGNSGQVVIIQSATGASVPIRVASSSNNIQDKQGGQVTIQVLKMPDGRLVQIRNNKALNLTNLANVTQLNVGGKKTGSVSGGSTIIVKTNSPSGAANAIAGIIKQKTSEISGKQLQKILPASSTIATSNSSALTPAILSAIKQQHAQKLLLPDNKEIRIKTDESGTKQIVVGQHLLKLSPNSPSPIQAIQIPGKPGLQYVRVLGTASGAGTGSKGGTIIAGIRKDSSPTKMAVIPHLIGNQKFLMASKPRPSLPVAHISKDTNSSKQGHKSLITTVPTLRKISDSTASKPTVSPKEQEEDPISTDSANKAKISHLNQQIKKFSSSMTASITSNGQHQNTQNSKTQRLMVPLELFRQMQSGEGQATKTSSETSPKKLYSVLKPSSDAFDEPLYPVKKRSPSPEALPRRKHCNCTKSQCLKLYCDCFANGEFCQDCNCKECYNNLEFEDERQKAIKICLERNPNAFKPKITKSRDQNDLRLHNKGCNCKRSGCLKNYCECYEAKIACSSNCKCFGCRNVEDRSEMDPLEVAKIAQNFGRGVSTKRHYDEIADKSAASSSAPQPPPSKQPYNFITQDVVDATIQCMIAQADECKKSGINTKSTERMILEELGRCLVEIIDFSIRNMDN